MYMDLWICGVSPGSREEAGGADRRTNEMITVDGSMLRAQPARAEHRCGQPARAWPGFVRLVRGLFSFLTQCSRNVHKVHTMFAGFTEVQHGFTARELVRRTC